MHQRLNQASMQLAKAWQEQSHMPNLAQDCRPQNRVEAYAVQAAIVEHLNEPTVGWKIAATSEGGQRHINVGAPLAGRLFRSRILPDGAVIPLTGNRMRVAEAEFGFRLAKSIPASSQNDQPGGISLEEMLAAVADMVLAIELPDSRFEAFVTAGEAQLIADFACARHFVLGPTVNADWRSRDLSTHPVRCIINDQVAAEGSGAFVLGDPRQALHWLLREMASHHIDLHQGDVIFTGTCVVPVPVKPGDRLCADFADFGRVTASLS